MEILSTFTNALSGIHNNFEKWKSDGDLHKNLLALECKYNLDLIDLLEWKDISKEFTYEVCKQLSTISLEAVMNHGDKASMSFLFDRVFDSPVYKSESRIIAIIARIHILKQIITLKEKYPNEGNPNLALRIENIKEILLDILTFLQEK